MCGMGRSKLSLALLVSWFLSALLHVSHDFCIDYSSL